MWIQIGLDVLGAQKMSLMIESFLLGIHNIFRGNPNVDVNFSSHYFSL